MDRIYSRKRIKFPRFRFSRSNIPNKNNKKIKKFIKLVLIVSIAFLTIQVTIKAIGPIYQTICADKAKSIATLVSNKKATEIMTKYSYEDLITIMFDESGKVSLVKANIIPINQITSELAVKIQEDFNEIRNTDFGIYLGSFTGIRFISGMGPKINFRIASIGNVETTLRSEFLEAGINQTLHKLYLDVYCEVSILTPFSVIDNKIENQVILAETVIVGITPETYYRLEGIKSGEELEVVN